MDDFINVIKKDPQNRTKIKDTLDKNIKLSLKYQSKIGYDTLSQTVFLKEKINLMGITLVGTDIERKLEIGRIKCLESRILRLFFSIINGS